MTAPLAVAVSLPYLALTGWLARRRAGAPSLLWIQWLWTGLGAYAIYVWALLRLVPAWRDLLEKAAGPGAAGAVALSGLGLYGALAMAIGLVGAWLYRRRVRRLPQMAEAPPEA